MTDVQLAAIKRLISESPGIRLGAALDACREAGYPLPDTSNVMVSLIRSGEVELTVDRRLYAR